MNRGRRGKVGPLSGDGPNRLAPASYFEHMSRAASCRLTLKLINCQAISYAFDVYANGAQAVLDQ